MFLAFFFTIPVKIENAIIKLALAIPAGAPITVANAIEMLPVVTDKKLVTYQNSQEKQFIYYPAGTQRPEDVPLWFCFA